MENQELDLENLSKEDFMEMAKYVAYVENQNKNLLKELADTKAYLTATIQQRNSLNARLQSMMEQKVNTIDISAMQTQVVTNIELLK